MHYIVPFLETQARNQYIAVFIANLITFNHGTVIGWLSPALLILQSEMTPLSTGRLNPEQVSLLASSLDLGIIIGALLFGFITSWFGTWWALICLGPSHIFWWTIVAFGNEYSYLVVGRLIVGVTGGAICRVIPHFVAEIAQPEIRGKLATISVVSFNTGIFLGFSMKGYFSYQLIPFTIVLPICYFLLMVFFVPKTPRYWIAKREFQEAYLSLLFYRTIDLMPRHPEKIREELQGMREMHNALQTKTFWRSLASKEAWVGLSMATFLSILVECSGSFLLIQFTAPVLAETGSGTDSKDAAIIVAAVQVLGTYSSIHLIDRIGRRKLVLTSCSGATVFLALLGFNSYLFTHNPKLAASYGAIPVLSLTLAILFFSIGLLSLQFVVLPEILPPEIINSGLTVALLVNGIFGYMNTAIFPWLLLTIKVEGIVWYFALSCAVGFVVCAAALPETNGKKLNTLR